MLNQIALYAIIGLIIMVTALSGGWYISNRLKSAEIDALWQRNAVLTSAVETNERTIADMARDAAILAAANQRLTGRIIAAEMEFVDEWSAINALDLEADTGDVTALENRVNEEFGQSVLRLRTTTAR